MAPASRTGRGFGADASGTVWEVGLMREQLAGREDPPGGDALSTYLTGDIAPEAVERFFEAAAALYQLRPWKRIPSDGHPFQLTCSALAIQGWVGCVIGQMRRRFQVEVGGELVPATIGAVVPSERSLQQPATPAKAATPLATATSAVPLKVPAALRQTVDNLLARIDPFCARHLNDDYRVLIHEAVAALARKRPSPLLSGREPSWCAGVLHAIGAVNFLFDPSQSPHCSAATIAAHFGVATSTSHNHAKKVRELLKITPFSPRWSLPSLLESSDIPWILEVDGFLRDIRSLPIEIQVEACAKGLIPYVPALRDQARGGA